MHIDILPNRKSHPTILLRESYRGADGRPKKLTLHNLTNALSLEQAYHWRALLQGAPVADRPLKELFEVSWALPHGHVAAILHTMDDLKLPDLIARTADSATVADQLTKLRQRFALTQAIVVGDRGMLTTAALEASAQDPTLADYGWISALTADQLRGLLCQGDLQPDLFDQRALAEIQSEAFAGERLIVCRNPDLAQERARKRQELIERTQSVLQSIQGACRRARTPYQGKDRIARRVEREGAQYKRIKHFQLTITEKDLLFEADTAAIERESRLDGFTVVRARHVSAHEMSAAHVGETSQSLCSVEQAFRCLKTESLAVRPIFHRGEDMGRAHVFVCVLALYVQWHMERRLAPVLLADEELESQKAKRPTPVEKSQRSAGARAKIKTKRTQEGLVAQSFGTLMAELAAVSRLRRRPAVEGAGSFSKLSELTALQEKALGLLGVSLRATPSAQGA